MVRYDFKDVLGNKGENELFMTFKTKISDIKKEIRKELKEKGYGKLLYLGVRKWGRIVMNITIDLKNNEILYGADIKDCESSTKCTDKQDLIEELKELIKDLESEEK